MTVSAAFCEVRVVADAQNVQCLDSNFPPSSGTGGAFLCLGTAMPALRAVIGADLNKFVPEITLLLNEVERL